ncbi:hypothetical protein EJB05_51867, partial [Eragrostis curvula]
MSSHCCEENHLVASAVSVGGEAAGFAVHAWRQLSGYVTFHLTRFNQTSLLSSKLADAFQ